MIIDIHIANYFLILILFQSLTQGNERLKTILTWAYFLATIIFMIMAVRIINHNQKKIKKWE